MNALTRHRTRGLAAAALGLVVLVAGAAGVLLRGGDAPDGAGGPGSEENANEREVLYWYDPMVPDVHFDEPGPSPFMDMNLVPRFAGEDGAGVRLQPDTVQRLGIRVTEAQRETLQPRIDAPGRVEFDQRGLARVHTRVDGWIERLHVRTEGESVDHGQPLFDLYSPALINAQRDLLQALRRERGAEAEAARERLRALGVDDGQISTLEARGTPLQAVTVHARQSGVVRRLNVSDGTHVTPAIEVMELAALERVWVIADVFERDAAHLSAGQSARVAVPFLPGTTLDGRIDHVYPELDRRTRTVPVRLVFDAGGGGRALRPGMYASVEILGTAREPAVTVPREAVIRTGREDRVMRYLGDGRYAPQTVTVGAAVDGRLEILSGLQAGDRVVTSGVFLLDSETNVRDFAARAAAADDPAPGDALTAATVTAIDREAARVTLDHEEIPGVMPAMEMGFDVDDPALLEGLAEGDRVRFALREGERPGRHVVTAIEAADAALTAATVTAVDREAARVTLDHEEIPGVMPAMEMGFDVDDPALLEGLAEGDRVRFGLREGERPGRYVVTAIEAAE